MPLSLCPACDRHRPDGSLPACAAVALISPGPAGNRDHPGRPSACRGEMQSGPAWQPFSAVDDNVVTGQNPAASREVAQRAVEGLDVRAHGSMSSRTTAHGRSSTTRRAERRVPHRKKQANRGREGACPCARRLGAP